MSDAQSGALDDGRYDAFIVWAEQRDNGIALECAITAGAHRGDVVTIVSNTLPTKDELALVGLPCTLIVERARDPRHVRLSARIACARLDARVRCCTRFTSSEAVFDTFA